MTILMGMFRINIRAFYTGFFILFITAYSLAYPQEPSRRVNGNSGNEAGSKGFILHQPGDSSDKKAIEGLRNAEKLFEKDKNNALGLETFLKFGQYYFGLNKTDSALYYYNRTLDLAIILNDTSGMAQSNLYIGQLYASAGNPALSKEYLNKAKELYTLSGNQEGEIQALIFLADYNLEGGENETNRQLFEKIIGGGTDGNSVAAAYFGMAKIYLRDFRYTKAYSCLIEAFNRWENSGDKTSAVKVLYQIGYIYQTLEMGNEARAVLSAVISEATPENISEIPLANAGLGTVYANLNDFGLAQEFADRAVAQSDSLQNDIARIRSYLAKSFLLFKKNNFAEAKDYAQKARQIAVQNNFLAEINSASAMISKTLFSLGDYDEAARYSRETLADAQSKNDVVQIKQNAAILGKIMHERGQFISSARFLNMSVEFEDSVKQVIQRIGLIEKPASFQTFALDKNQQYDKTISPALFRKSRFNLKQMILIFSITLLLISTILAYIFYKNSKKSKWENESLRTSNEAINGRLKKLENLLSMNSKIFTSISHDLRSPIIAVNNSIELLKYDAFDEEKKKKALDMSQDQVEATLNLLDNLLRWAKNQTEQIKPQMEPVNVCDAIFQTMKLFKTPLDKKEINFHSNCDSSVIANADNELMNIILRNLISNAMKFTPRKGNINVAASSNGTKIYVSVADTGIGISKENQEKILNPNFFITNKGTENERGSGIGLKLCVEYIRLMNGDLKVESNIGEGSKFTFSLPVYIS